jgi:hypothetical protein
MTAAFCVRSIHFLLARTYGLPGVFGGEGSLIKVSPARQVDFVELAFGDVTYAAAAS